MIVGLAIWEGDGQKAKAGNDVREFLFAGISQESGRVVCQTAVDYWSMSRLSGLFWEPAEAGDRNFAEKVSPLQVLA